MSLYSNFGHKRKQIGPFFLFLYLFVVCPKKSSPNFQNPEVFFYQFLSPLDFALYPKKIKYFKGYGSINTSLLCSFVPFNINANSSPRDVVFTITTNQQCNLVLFLRTLRTTQSNCSIVLFMDRKCIKTMDRDTLQFISEMDAQIILIPDKEYKGMDSKSFVFYAIKEFLLENQNLVDRGIYLDMFDCLFQADPFDDLFSGSKIQIVDEGYKLGDNDQNIWWMKLFDPYFNLSARDINTINLNAGVFGARADQLIRFCAVTLTMLRMHDEFDQGAVNVLYFFGGYRKHAIFMTEKVKESRIRHIMFNCVDGPFGNVSAHLNQRITGSILHMYYMTNRAFICTLLQSCPKITDQMSNYLNPKLSIPEEELSNCNEFVPQPDTDYARVMHCKPRSYYSDIHLEYYA